MATPEANSATLWCRWGRQWNWLQLQIAMLKTLTIKYTVLQVTKTIATMRKCSIVTMAKEVREEHLVLLCWNITICIGVWKSDYFSNFKHLWENKGSTFKLWHVLVLCFTNISWKFQVKTLNTFVLTILFHTFANAQYTEISQWFEVPVRKELKCERSYFGQVKTVCKFSAYIICFWLTKRQMDRQLYNKKLLKVCEFSLNVSESLLEFGCDVRKKNVM